MKKDKEEVLIDVNRAVDNIQTWIAEMSDPKRNEWGFKMLQ